MKLVIELDVPDEADYVAQVVYDALKSIYTEVPVPTVDGEPAEVLEDPIWSLVNLVE